VLLISGVFWPGRGVKMERDVMEKFDELGRINEVIELSVFAVIVMKESSHVEMVMGSSKRMIFGFMPVVDN
jgi:hypothetical protein